MKLLSLDGGGVRGVISAVWLQEIRRHLDIPLYEAFDLIAGTSTGSILAIGSAMGIEPKEMVSMYTNKAHIAFPRGNFGRFKSRILRLVEGKGLSVPRYDGKGLDRLLKETIGEDQMFGDMKTRVLVPTYDIEQSQPRMFKSWREECADIPAWEVARASSAAPTYLPAHKLFTLGRDQYLLDGGLVANNPSMCALAEAIRLGAKKEDITLVSLGTGQSTQTIEGKKAQHWGGFQWAPNIINTIMDGSSDIQTYHTKMIIGERCFRFQMMIPKELAKMDDSNPKHIKELVRLARRYMGRTEVKAQLRKMLGVR
jgi:patatin-like phospholipase/acyl hydrolase